MVTKSLFIFTILMLVKCEIKQWDYFKTRQPALIFPTSYLYATFLGVRTRGGYDPKFKLGRDFCTMHL